MKAIFMDYTGTMVQERGPEIEEVVMRICQKSAIRDPKRILQLWWTRLKKYEETSYKTSYLTEDQIVDRLLAEFQEEFQLSDNLEELHTLIQNFWVNAPLFPDVKEFCQRCPVPLYVISNNGVPYVEKSMRQKGLSPSGIICADMVYAYKPHREIFEKALEISGCTPEEVVHVGDSYSSDVLGALSAGIQPILIQRKGENAFSDIPCIQSLAELDFENTLFAYKTENLR